MSREEDQDELVEPPRPLLGLPRRELLSALELDWSDEDLVELVELVGGVAELDGVLDHLRAPDLVGSVWKRLLDLTRGQRRSGMFSRPNALCLLVVREVFSAVPAGDLRLETSLGSVGLHLRGTWREVNLRLGRDLYFYSQELNGPSQKGTFGVVARAALECWEVVQSLDDRPEAVKARKGWRGMRAVTQLFMARTSGDPEPLLWRSIEDFTVAENCGDRSVQHFELRAEAHERLAMITDSVAQLDAAHACLRAARAAGHDTVQLSSAWGALMYSKGMLLQGLAASTPDGLEHEDGAEVNFGAELLGPDAEPARAHLDPTTARAAIGAFTAAALWYGRAAQAAVDDRVATIQRIKRGQASQRVAQARRWLGLPIRQQVRAAVEDLRACAEPGAPISTPHLPWAMLALARDLATENSAEALAEASAATAEALAYASTHLPPDAPMVPGLLDLAGEVELRSALLVEEPAVTRRALSALLAANPDLSGVRVGPVRYAARRLVPVVDAQDAVLVRAVIDALEQLARNSIGDHRRAAAQAAASLLSVTDGAGPVGECDPAVLERVYVLMRMALDENPETDDLILRVAYAKAAARRARTVPTGDGEDARLLAVELYTEAINEHEWLASRIEEDGADVPGTDAVDPEAFSLDEMINSSGLGDAYLRRSSLTRYIGDVRAAIDWLERSRVLGNESPAHLSLLGEAYLRYGRKTGDAESLQAAVRWKEEARRKGAADGEDVARESYSSAAAASWTLWRRSHDVEAYVAGARLAVLSAAVDEKWPWPVLQLERYASERAAVRSGLAEYAPVDEVMEVRGDQRLWDAVRKGDTVSLRLESCERAVAATEFEARDLGARSGNRTYFLDDPHGLLSTTLVIKQTQAEAAALGEIDRLRSFKAFAEVQKPSWLRLVEPLAAVKPTGGEGRSVVVSLRASGVPLSGRFSADERTAPGEVLTAMPRVMESLAMIHAWRGTPLHEMDRLLEGRRNLRKQLIRLGFPDAFERASRWHDLVPVGLPVVGKRDAHLNNWLLTDDGGLVPVDLESTAFLPVGQEVAQVLEDMPLFGFDPEGIAARRDLADRYLSELARRRPDLAPDLPDADSPRWWTAYACFVGLRAIYLLHQNATGEDKYKGFARRRAEHARSALEWAVTVCPGLAVLT